MTAPARLLSVRLQGFKSFADRTHVAFGPGISAVVGPNGSGKSNLADALRWALGEQGRALRSRKAEDVIWAGSEKRPAVGMADVQLTFDNEDGLLPVEFGVVELGRRLYRSGENDYLVNRQRVRLRDLVELLDAGHLADNAFLFIGQGMVDQALALRPEERRPLFEEVAGVRRHERRRRRAEEQLEEATANLARVEDILGELRPQARRLAQQAEQQANRRSAGDELATALLSAAHHRWHAAAARVTAAERAGLASRSALDDALRALGELEARVAALSAAAHERAAAEASQRRAVDAARQEHARLQLQAQAAVSELASLERERARLATQRIQAERDAAEARRAVSAPITPQHASLDEDLSAAEAALATARADLDAAAGADAEEVAAIRRLEATRAAELAAARRRALDAERVAAEEEQRAARADARAAEARVAAAELADRLAASTAAAASARDGREAAERALGEAEARARMAAEEAGTARAAAGGLAGSLEQVRRAIEADGGRAFSGAAAARGGEAFDRDVAIEQRLRTAVDAVLGRVGRAMVVSRRSLGELLDESGVAIVAERLASGGTEGDAGIPAGELIEQVRRRGGGRLVGAIQRDGRRALQALLARAVWLPSAADCIDVQELLPPGWVAVSLDGSIVVGDVVAWVRPETAGIQREAEAERLAAALRDAERRAADAGTALATAEAELGAARSNVAAARQAEGAAVPAARRTEDELRAATGALETAERDAAWLRAHAERLAGEARRARAAVPPEPIVGGSTPATTIGGAEAPASGGARLELEARVAELRARRDEVAAAVATANATRLEGERSRARAEAAVAIAERRLAEIEAQAADAVEREAQLTGDRERLAVELASAGTVLAAADETLARTMTAEGSARTELRTAEEAATAARDAVRSREERTRAAEREELEARLGLESLREQLLVELGALGGLALRHLMLVARIAGVANVAGDPSIDAEGPDAAGSDAGGSDADPEAIRAALEGAAAVWARDEPSGEPPPAGRLASLRRRFHELGAGNPFAADEFAEVKARLDGLESQRSDLASAIEQTRTLIAELDRMISDQFRTTFRALEAAFDRRFQQLFGGGFAQLTLTDPADLAATGVEIVARPPGKKPQALAMLSGGERALTAVALLFAMLEVRPVPFCVLDEVDAALDEANIGRFTDALRELSRATQCIVITHNRGTIESADAMYGVTVGDDSVSRVISLRLEEATALATRARRTSAPAEATLAGAGAPEA